MMVEAVLALFGVFALIAAVNLYMFFSPFRLGPAPAVLLQESFFATSCSIKDIRLYIDGKEAFGAIFESIARAKEIIHVQTFIWKNDSLGRRMVDAVVAAADRGVRVTLSKDLLGTYFEFMSKGERVSPLFNSKALKGHERITLDLDPRKLVDHSKYFIIDGNEAIFGGMNVADEYHDDWHDYMLGLHDASLSAMFENKLLRGGAWPVDAPFVIATNTGKAAEIRTGVMQVIGAAKERLLFEHAYFSATMIIEGIEQALARGVRVDIVLPASPSTHGPANRVAVNRLLAGPNAHLLRVFFFPRMTHAKALVADGRIVAIGSANMTPRSLYVSGETVMFANFAPEHPFVTRLCARIESDMAESERILTPFAMNPAQRARALAGKYIW